LSLLPFVSEHSSTDIDPIVTIIILP
jgi:hypothetical protein